MCFRHGNPAVWLDNGKVRGDADDSSAVCAIVFGTDQGLVGRFNEVVADHALKTLAALPGGHQVWAIGQRVHARLADAGMRPAGLFNLPNSVHPGENMTGVASVRQACDLLIFKVLAPERDGDPALTHTISQPGETIRTILAAWKTFESIS